MTGGVGNDQTIAKNDGGGVIAMGRLYFLWESVVGVFFTRGTEFYEIAELGCLLSLPACLFVGINIFGSGLLTAFSNGLVSGVLSFIRTFLILTYIVLRRSREKYGYA